eukprot:scaffold89529_cov56-Attheya_sp.AAC.3
MMLSQYTERQSVAMTIHGLPSAGSVDNATSPASNRSFNDDADTAVHGSYELPQLYAVVPDGVECELVRRREICSSTTSVAHWAIFWASINAVSSLWMRKSRTNMLVEDLLLESLVPKCFG